MDNGPHSREQNTRSAVTGSLAVDARAEDTVHQGDPGNRYLPDISSSAGGADDGRTKHRETTHSCGQLFDRLYRS